MAHLFDLHKVLQPNQSHSTLVVSSPALMLVKLSGKRRVRACCCYQSGGRFHLRKGGEFKFNWYHFISQVLLISGGLHLFYLHCGNRFGKLEWFFLLLFFLLGLHQNPLLVCNLARVLLPRYVGSQVSDLKRLWENLYTIHQPYSKHSHLANVATNIECALLFLNLRGKDILFFMELAKAQ